MAVTHGSTVGNLRQLEVAIRSFRLMFSGGNGVDMALRTMERCIGTII